MYNVNYFREKDMEVVKDFMKQNTFAVLCGCSADGKPVATHVPLLIEERNDKLFLLGHFMRKTDHHKAFEQNPAALAIFNGPHTYVSASWYQNPQSASTWNYITVHAHGQLRLLEQDRLYDILTRTTRHFENNPDSPALVEKMPADYINSMSKAIIAFEVEVTALDNVFKLSQNRDAATKDAIIHQLKQRDTPDDTAIAEEMEKRREQ
ncbi:MAG: FMN-binding negative transcriptional regulator [Agriterribacter sp.]